MLGSFFLNVGAPVLFMWTCTFTMYLSYSARAESESDPFTLSCCLLVNTDAVSCYKIGADKMVNTSQNYNKKTFLSSLLPQNEGSVSLPFIVDVIEWNMGYLMHWQQKWPIFDVVCACFQELIQSMFTPSSVHLYISLWDKTLQCALSWDGWPRPTRYKLNSCI